MSDNLKNKDNIPAKDNSKDDSDYDFWSNFFGEEEKSNEKNTNDGTKDISTPIIPEIVETKPTEEKKSDDNFDWLKDLIDEIDREEKEKQKAQVNLPPVQPKNPYPKQHGAPLAPTDGQYIQKQHQKPETLTGPIPPLQQDNQLNKKNYYIYTLCALLFILNIGLVYYSFIRTKSIPNYCGSSIILNKVYFGDRILVDTNYVQRHELVERGYVDSQISGFLYKFINKGDKVMDIGAGFGYYTIYMSRLVGPEGKVYSFEARKNIYNLLEASILINKISNVELFNKLLFSSKTRVIANPDVKKQGNFGTITITSDKNEQSESEENTIMIDTVGLDDVLQDLKNISLMHINAHGHELSIILGAKHIIAFSPKLKIITSWSKQEMSKHINVQNMVSQFLDLGFRFWLIKPSNGTLVEMQKLDQIMQVENGRFVIARNLN